VVNVDGREARRAKWGGVARGVLSWSERRAIRAADAIVADNAALAAELTETYGLRPKIIAYGADHARRGPGHFRPRPARGPTRWPSPGRSRRTTSRS
jgi:hypothetical protein